VSLQETCGHDTPDGPCALPPHRRGWHDSNPPVVKVPRNKDGRPQVSITQLRTYGATDLLDDDAERVAGCPRAYALTYGGPKVPEVPNRAGELGGVLHRALHWMDQFDTGPEEALGRVWPPTLGPEDYADAVEILLGYLEREGPMTRYATLDTELDLSVPLFTDDTYGQVFFRGIIDNLAVDPLEPDVVHVIDFKSASRPVGVDDLRGNIQLRGYVWLARRWWMTQHGQPPARIVAHLDLLRYGDVAIEYTRREIEVWHEWACAMVRTMLRDQAAMPILNNGCTWCPVRWGCPAWRDLPGTAMSLWARMTGMSEDQLRDRYADATQVLGLLTRQHTQLKETLEAEAHAKGRLVVGDQEWVSEPGTKKSADVLAMARLLLPQHPQAFAMAVKSSQSAAEKAGRDLEPSLRDELINCVSSVPAGRTIKKRKVKR